MDRIYQRQSFERVISSGVQKGQIVEVQQHSIKYMDNHGTAITAYAETEKDAERLMSVHFHAIQR